MPTLYVIQPNARIEKDYERILVTCEDETLMRLPIQTVSAVVLVGPAGATTPAIHALLGRGIPMFFVKYNGDLLGRLQPASNGNLPLRQAQYRLNDDAQFSLSLARQIVHGKIHNQMILAARIARRTPGADLSVFLKRLQAAKTQAVQCASIESLRGVEGSAAQAYFNILKAGFGADWKFENRSRRPPKDEVNALLSLSYTFLGYAMMTALEVVGLEPYLGYFHQEAYNRPSLALDLLEEFRAPLADSLVLGLVKKRLLQKQDFVPDEVENVGIRLTPHGLRIFFRELSDKFESTVTSKRVGRPISYRKLMEVQARRLANVILGKEAEYQPFLSR